ncbi:M4 family metallopeptidase [Streptomyces xanthii]|uniref:Neutral metalloproteinase n=1 Tax=Streptomyces xanthii TaxID=2768069 RepID=A0A7H1BHQ7_9ACTN|nr:M4 family metallopeptidase [Streptomyces xanthii]QNS08262.1 M4 family metallopeptidase [Streptomyces xanthii]
MSPLHSRRSRTKLTVISAVSAGTLISGGLALTAFAGSPDPSTSPGAPATAGSPGAAPAELTEAERAELIRQAQAGADDTARRIGLGPDERLVVKSVVQDVDGTVHTRYERTYSGIPVLGGDLVVHTAGSGSSKGVTRARKGTVEVATLTPDVPADRAQQQAVSAAEAQGSERTTADGAPRKVIWNVSGRPVLAYETVVGGLQDDGTPNQLYVITDASTGKKLFEYQAVVTATGTGRSQYAGKVALNTARSGSRYQLKDATRGGHKVYNSKHTTGTSTGSLFIDKDNTWGDGRASGSATGQTAAVDVAYGAQKTWDFYKDTFGRLGIRNNGQAAYSRVHYGDQYQNAFWDDGCFCMTYGDGKANTHPLTELDVAAHEMTHGVTNSTAGLQYTGESGGLNEATSDIMGTGAEFYAKNRRDAGDYLIGEKIDLKGDGTPLRHMDRPSKDGASADYWSPSVGSLDVHHSSGVANHFFYLLSEGSGAKTVNGVSYDSPTADGAKVAGIGRAKALQIWYKALTTYFTSTTDYAGARTGTLMAARDLYGAGSTEYDAVRAAWSGVNVD